MLTIGHKVPDFRADTNLGPINFHEWMAGQWCVLFSHPKDFTPVCTTELGEAARLEPEFERRNLKLIGLSIDSVERHEDWSKDIEKVTGHKPSFPMIADTDLNVAKAFGMLPAEASGDADQRTPADNATVRTVFIIAPDKTVRMAMAYPMSSGRNFAEIIRVLDSIQLTEDCKVATPVNWEPGEDVIILPSIGEDEARSMFTDWTAPLPYMRLVPQPERDRV